MENLVPGEYSLKFLYFLLFYLLCLKSGSIAEREHIKWLHAAPIANNPYCVELLNRRLSETQTKQKVMDIHTLLQQHEPPLLEDKSDENEVVQAQQRPNIIKSV